jgi:hypothetical protein
MAYGDIGDAVTGAEVTEAYLDQIRANFQAGVPDIFTTEGDIAIATGADAAARLAVGAADSFLVAGAARPEWQIAPAARVYNDAAIDPATSTWVTLTFNQERFDTDTVHSTASNTSRLTIPANGNGLYLIGGNVSFDNGGGAGESQMGIRILLNGATVIAQYYAGDDNDVDTDRSITTLYSLSATDYVELQVYTTGNVNVLASGNYSPEFWAIWQRRQ